MSFSVRPAVLQDAAQLVQLLKHMAWESENLALDQVQLQQGVKAVFDHPERGQYWVIQGAEQGVVYGMCMVTFEWSDWHNRFYWWFQSVYILPEYRGQGLLALLMTHVQQVAQQEGAQELRLYVESQNHQAIRAYEKLGYQTGYYHVMQKHL